MKMKEWPDNDEVVNFEELTGPVVQAIQEAYKLIPLDVSHGIEWTGLNIGKKLLAHSFSPEEALSATYLPHGDRSPLEVIVGIAVQLGIEQGRRMAAGDQIQKRTIELADRLAKYLEGKEDEKDN
jgi:hypothetical protein